MVKSASDLPQVMLTEIFLRLPVKSLLRCKSVCKPWLHTISNPDFIKSQIFASQKIHTLLNIVNEEQLDAGNSAITETELVDFNGQGLSCSPIHFEYLVMPHVFQPTQVICSCDGIICLYNKYGDVVYLWNPSIRRCKKLPPPTRQTSTSVPIMLGFGYDSSSNDYKVLRIVYENRYDFVPIVQVYSTNADCYREFRAPILKKWMVYARDNINVYRRTNTFVNGVLYFDGGDELVSFDLHDEVFGLIPFPRFVQRKMSDVLDFKCSVAMIFESGPGVDLWTLNNVSGQLSWTKKFSIEVDIEMEIWVSFYLGAQQFYGTNSLNRTCFLHDYEKKKTKYYGLGKESVLATLEYIETLVSLDGSEQVQ
ncbi:hypothetical protein POM88_008755 [Heracleum sosnowskyi]|uniref:F-box domain-containing protein n=1 Tax=Heracleum sosnowskyi TaxID=360622 RepID=A0AAD8JAK2_9APIA|nr:hypothetical protein POM88_008755 [Heracleum sosnowskyi]